VRVHWFVHLLTSALGAVGPLDVDRDRDGLAVVADVEAVEFAAPLVRRVLDRLAIHGPRVEQMFGLVETVSQHQGRRA